MMVEERRLVCPVCEETQVFLETKRPGIFRCEKCGCEIDPQNPNPECLCRSCAKILS
jgi:ribosomal protein L37AE/L43A